MSLLRARAAAPDGAGGRVQIGSTATSNGTTTTLVDSTLPGVDLTGRRIVLVGGTNNLHQAVITGHAGSTLTFSPAAPTGTASGDSYRVN